MKILQPPGWAKPRGFSNGIAIEGGTTVFIAGQIAFNSQNIIEEKTFAGQFRQTLKNTLAVLAEAGGWFGWPKMLLPTASAVPSATPPVGWRLGCPG